MNLDLDALGEKTFSVKLGGKSIEVKQITLGQYIKALAIREGAGDNVESAAEMLRKLCMAFAPGSFTEAGLIGLSARQLAELVKQLEKFQSGVEDDGGNPVPGKA